MKNIICNICKSQTIYLDKIEGYLGEGNYDIYHCKNCGCNQIDTKNLNTEIYDSIYSKAEKINGYDRYLDYAKNIKNSSYPLKWLAENEDTYTILYDYFKKQKNLDILEIGCGFGYTTYALNKSGNNCIGIDISKKSIDYAIEKFGNNYLQYDIYKDKKEIKSGNFDVIVATELIEHLNDIDGFFEFCLKNLKQTGVIILTTPNKDFSPKDAIRIGDLPPIHTIWFSSKSFKYLADKYGFNIKFFNYSSKVLNKNYLLQKLLSRRIKISKPILNSNNGKINLFGKIGKFKPIVKISNVLGKLVYGSISSSSVLGVILTKR